MRYVLIIAILFLSLPVSAQNKSGVAKKSAKTTKSIASEPTMPEASYEIGEYISKHLHYPDSAVAHNIQGRVLIKFMVDKKGRITDCKVAQSLNKYCDAEALRVVKSMPPWKPGTKDGKPVKVYYTLPIAFKLD